MWKHAYSLLALSMLAILVGASPALAQDDPGSCPLNLAQVYLRLTNAQIAWDAGNSQAALQSLGEAQTLLGEIASRCASGSAQTPARGPGAVVLYLDDKGPGQFTKLNAVAFANGLDLTIAESEDQFEQLLAEPATAAAIYGSGSESRAPSDRALLSLEGFVQDGGRALLFYDGAWTDESKLIQDLFGIAVAGELVAAGEGNLRYPDSALPAWLSGMKLGVEADEIWLTAYLIIPSTEGMQLAARSGETGRDRVVFYEAASGNLIWMPRITQCVAWQYGCVEADPTDWFDDRNIDFFDNEQAVLALLRYLSG